MGNLTVGRAGYDVALPYAEAWDTSGDTVTIKGTIAGTVEEALTLRGQLLGHAAGTDEPYIPVTCDDDPTISGYYSLDSAGVTMDGASLASGSFDFELGLTRVPGYAAPLLEETIVSVRLPPALVLGDPPFGTPTPLSIVELIHAAPGTVDGYHWSGFTNTGAPFARATTDGDLVYLAHRIGYATAPASFARYYCPPEDHYLGSPSLVVAGRTAAGRQIIAEPYDWRLDNGLVRVMPDPADAGALLVEAFGGARWESLESWSFGNNFGFTGNRVTAIQTVTALRVGAEQTIIRLGVTLEHHISDGRINIDLSLRRGDRLVRGYISTDAQSQWTLIPTPTFDPDLVDITSVGVTYEMGVEADADDTDGNRPVAFAGEAFTVGGDFGAVLTQGAVGTGFAFALGAAIDITDHAFDDGDVPESVLDLGLQFFAAQSARLSIVGR